MMIFNVYLPNAIGMIKSTRTKLAGHVTHMEEMRNVYKILVGKVHRKRLLRIFKRKWEQY
jgi:hypothetical protein